MKKEQKHISILGAGESGVGAAILAKKQGWNVFVSDFGKIKQEFKDELDTYDLKWEENQHSEDILLTSDLIIKSPGIPDKSPVIKKLKEKGIKIISEIEFGGYYLKAKTMNEVDAGRGGGGGVLMICATEHDINLFAL